MLDYMHATSCPPAPVRLCRRDACARAGRAPIGCIVTRTTWVVRESVSTVKDTARAPVKDTARAWLHVTHARARRIATMHRGGAPAGLCSFATSTGSGPADVLNHLPVATGILLMTVAFLARIIAALLAEWVHSGS